MSWLEFVLLILACLLCICPKAKEASYSVAYPLVIYCTALVFIQYIYGLNLRQDELKDVKDVGLKRDESGVRGIRSHIFMRSIFKSQIYKVLMLQ